MKIILTYQRYARQHFSTAEYFKDIVSSIDPTYKHKIQELKTLFYPLSFDEVEDVKAKGLVVTYSAPDSTSPHLVIQELNIEFLDVSGPYEEVLQHLISLYGQKATEYSVIDRGYLNANNL